VGSSIAELRRCKYELTMMVRIDRPIVQGQVSDKIRELIRLVKTRSRPAQILHPERAMAVGGPDTTASELLAEVEQKQD
jgi:hypothetical protein